MASDIIFGRVRTAVSCRPTRLSPCCAQAFAGDQLWATVSCRLWIVLLGRTFRGNFWGRNPESSLSRCRQRFDSRGGILCFFLGDRPECRQVFYEAPGDRVMCTAGAIILANSCTFPLAFGVTNRCLTQCPSPRSVGYNCATRLQTAGTTLPSARRHRLWGSVDLCPGGRRVWIDDSGVRKSGGPDSNRTALHLREIQ